MLLLARLVQAVLCLRSPRVALLRPLGAWLWGMPWSCTVLVAVATTRHARLLGYDHLAAPVLTRPVLSALLRGSIPPEPVSEILAARHRARAAVRADTTVGEHTAFGEHTARFVAALAGHDGIDGQQTALRALRLAQTDGWLTGQIGTAAAIYTSLSIPHASPHQHRPRLRRHP